METETELETRNRRKWETRRDKKHNFSTKNKKNGEKTGGKTLKEKGKNWNLQELQKQDETRFQRDKISARQDLDDILGNAENGNKNKVFSNVTKRQFESKNKVSVQA